MIELASADKHLKKAPRVKRNSSFNIDSLQSPPALKVNVKRKISSQEQKQPESCPTGPKSGHKSKVRASKSLLKSRISRSSMRKLFAE